jgi:hypothetical protein
VEQGLGFDTLTRSGSFFFLNWVVVALVPRDLTKISIHRAYVVRKFGFPVFFRGVSLGHGSSGPTGQSLF